MLYKVYSTNRVSRQLSLVFFSDIHNQLIKCVNQTVMIMQVLR